MDAREQLPEPPERDDGAEDVRDALPRPRRLRVLADRLYEVTIRTGDPT